jgi:hypothetical protein
VKKTCEIFQKEVLSTKTEYDITEEQYFAELRKVTEKWQKKTIISLNQPTQPKKN